MKPLSLLAILIFLGGVAWVFSWSPATVREVQRSYYTAITPFLKSGSRIERFSREFLAEVEHSKTVQKRIDAMYEDWGRLKIIENRFRELEAENAQLSSALNFKQSTPFEVVAAKVIKRQPSAWWQTVTINRGESSGIGPQIPVLAEGGLVGKVDQSFEGDLANVILISDESCQVSVYIEGTPEKGILSGHRGDYGSSPLLRLRFLSKNASIQEGMRVLTTGRGGLFPADIEVGYVKRFLPGAYEGEALVRPSANLNKLSVVFVLTGNGEIIDEEGSES